MASDTNIDRAIARLATSSSTSPASTSRRQQDQGRPAGQLHIHGRKRSMSLSSRASGFSHEELVRPALNYADDQDPLMSLPAPSSDRLINQPFYKRLTHVRHFPGWITLPMCCLSIALNALLANHPYTYPLYGPLISSSLNLSVTQGSSIALGGVLGTYLGAAPIGGWSDRQGPRMASLLSAGLAFVGYQSFALLLAHKDWFDPGSTTVASATSPNPPESPWIMPILLALSYFLLGGAAIGAYFSSLTIAALQFPKYPTLALSLPLSCFGLSSLTLSSIARIPIFLSENSKGEMELDPIRLTRFLGVFVPAVNCFAAIWLFVSDAAAKDYPEDPAQLQEETAGLLQDDQEVGDDSFADTEDNDVAPDLSASLHQELEDHRRRRNRNVPSRLATPSKSNRVASIASSAYGNKIVDPTEHTPLLIGGPDALYASVIEDTASVRRGPASNLEGQTQMKSEGQADWTFKTLGMNPGLWAFGGVMLLGMGPAEMILGNIGSIASSFTSADDDSLGVRSHLVLLLSVSSTVARLVTGVLVDYLAPVSVSPSGTGRRTILNRSAIAAGCLVVLAGALLWGALGVKDISGLNLLAIGVGGMYGAVFTITPAVTSRHFGPGHFGLAWGMVSYFVAAGAIFFSYLYAFISEYQGQRQSRRPGAGPGCHGTTCFGITFWVSSVSCLVAAVGMIWLGKRWKL